MTRIEAETAGGLGDGQGDRSRWSELLVPIVTAILVVALGLILVGLTSNGAAVQPGQISGAEAGSR